MLAVSVVDEIECLERLEGEWRALLARSATNEPVLSPAWLLPWWRVYGGSDGRALRAVLVRDGDRLVSLAPLLSRRHIYRPAIPFRRIEPLASGEREEEETCSDYLDMIVERGHEPAAAEALAATLADGHLDRFDELVLPSMNADGRLPALLAAALSRRGFAIELIDAGACHHVPLPARWDDYLAQLPPSSRYLVRRSLRDFEAWASGEAEVHVARTPAELAVGSAILRALHQETWLDRGRHGVFASPRFARFHDEVQARLLAEGALELSWIAVRDVPIAALYNIAWDGKIYFYQSGRKIELPRHIRPGIVAHAYAIRRAIEEGRSEYDFLAGSAQYKRQLALAVRRLVTLRAVRPGLRERARATAACAKRLARTIRRRATG